MATSTLSLLLALIAVPIVVVGTWITWLRVDGKAAMVVAVATITVVGLAQLGIVLGAGGNNFDAMAVVYLDLVVAVPLIAALLLLGGLVGRRWGVPRLSPFTSAAAACCLLLAPLGFYATHIEPFDVSVEHEQSALSPERDGEDPIRVGVLTDLQTTHIGSYQREAIQLLVDAHPDLVFVCGDVFQGTPSQFAHNREALKGLLAELSATAEVYVVQGDTDDGPTLDAYVSETRAHYLWNEVVETRVGDRTVRIAGLGNGRGHESLDAIDQLVASPPGTVRLVLVHRPDAVFDVPAGEVDLVASGHTHGGQIQLPFIGPLMTLTDVPRDVAAGGLHEVGGTPLYVSHGVGREQQGAPQIRFLDPPNVGLIELR